MGVTAEEEILPVFGVEDPHPAHPLAFGDATLAVKFHGHSIADVLDLTVEDALPLARSPTCTGAAEAANPGRSVVVNVPPAAKARRASGGEAQRMKLARELSKFTKQGS